MQAAESALKRHGSFGPLELFQAMLLLQPVHFEGWRNGKENHRLASEVVARGRRGGFRVSRHVKAVGFQRPVSRINWELGLTSGLCQESGQFFMFRGRTRVAPMAPANICCGRHVIA